MTATEYLFLALAALAVVVMGGAAVLLTGPRRRTRRLPSAPDVVPEPSPAPGGRGEPSPGTPGVSGAPEAAGTPGVSGATEAGDTPGTGADRREEAPAGPAVAERPEPAEGRLVRLRARLARSNNALGKGLLALLSRDDLDEATWEEVEETLLLADLGVGPTAELVDALRTKVAVLGARDARAGA